MTRYFRRVKTIKEGTMSGNWWLSYVPRNLESREVFIERVTGYREMQFCMMEVSVDDLEIVGRSYEITAVRHAYERDLYAVMVIRDLIFLTYTDRWGNGSN